MKIPQLKSVRELTCKLIFTSLFVDSNLEEGKCNLVWTNNLGKVCFDKNCAKTYIEESEQQLSNDMQEKLFNMLNCYCENKEKFDAIISKHLKGNFTIDKVAKMDLAILYTAMIELESSADLSEKIVVNEAIELAKQFSSANAFKFINGILGNIVKEMRVNE